MTSCSTWRGVALGMALLAASAQVAADEAATIDPPGAKELYLPPQIQRVPEHNDYRDPASDFCFDRMVQGPNVAIFWHKEYGDDPLAQSDPRKRFDVQLMLSECERFYDYYVRELKLVEQGQSISDKYKLLVFVFGGDEGTAFGGGIDDKVGAVWTPAVRVNRPPYGVLAHEMGHSFQFMSAVDSGARPGGPVNEMSAQYMLWQVYPEWMTFENYHLVDFMQKTHFAFLHPTNMYHAPYVLEFWSQTHGKEFYGKLSRATQRGEDVVTTYKRLAGADQRQFNDEMFDAARRFITWDLDRVADVARRYANQHQTRLQDADDGWLRVAPDRTPQDYGYNGIRLVPPAEGGEVRVDFRGLAGLGGAEDAPETLGEQAGWRYGFVAQKTDGSRVYSEVGREPHGSATFAVPAGAEHLWLVVMGAPTEHVPLPGGRRRRQAEAPAERQWPYQFQLTGAAVHPSCLE